jgi:hypothetical protein
MCEECILLRIMCEDWLALDVYLGPSYVSIANVVVGVNSYFKF